MEVSESIYQLNLNYTNSTVLNGAECALGSLKIVADISEVHVASIFGVEMSRIRE